MFFRAVLAISILFLTHGAHGQMRHPITEQLVAIPTVGGFIVESGNFNNYEAQFGLINHMSTRYGLQFITIGRDASLPWLVILNGGPGRSNLRLSFGIDSLLCKYNLLLPGYRGFDDGGYAVVFNSGDHHMAEFVRHHKQVFSIHAIADDILLIMSALEVDKYSVLAHSFGTIVGSYLLEKDTVRLDTLYAFSPVSEQYPFPDPQRLKVIMETISADLNIPKQQMTDTLRAWIESANNSNLVMGMFSSFYRYEEMTDFFQRTFEGRLTRTNIEKVGSAYLHKEWLFDFALKFEVVDPYTNSENLYEKISSLFIQALNVFNQSISSGSHMKKHCGKHRTKSVLSQYEFFFPNENQAVELEIYNSAHADIWHNAPELFSK